MDDFCLLADKYFSFIISTCAYYFLETKRITYSVAKNPKVIECKDLLKHLKGILKHVHVQLLKNLKMSLFI